MSQVKVKTPCVSAACSQKRMEFLDLCGESRTSEKNLKGTGREGVLKKEGKLKGSYYKLKDLCNLHVSPFLAGRLVT